MITKGRNRHYRESYKKEGKEDKGLDLGLIRTCTAPENVIDLELDVAAAEPAALSLTISIELLLVGDMVQWR